MKEKRLKNSYEKKLIKAYNECLRDIKNGNYYIGSIEEHMNRISFITK